MMYTLPTWFGIVAWRATLVSAGQASGSLTAGDDLYLLTGVRVGR